MNLSRALSITGSLSKPSKMPGYAIGLPAGKADWVKTLDPSIKKYGCNIGGKLRDVKGSTCASCYAVKGNYVFNKVKHAQLKRLQGISHPDWVEAMVEVLYMTIDPNEPYFRWHDSGDILDLNHLVNIVEVCRKTKYIRHWLPTREAGIVKKYLQTYGEFPANLIVRLSATSIDDNQHTWYGLTSTVHQNKEPVGHSCPAYTQGGKCGDCRACWSRKVVNVSYPKH